MFEWCSGFAWPVWGWWLVPLVCMVLCMTMCIFFRSRTSGRRFCCWGGVNSSDLEKMKEEIAVLKEEIAKKK